MKTNRSNTIVMTTISWILTSYAAIVTVVAVTGLHERPMVAYSRFQTLLGAMAFMDVCIFGAITFIGLVYSFAITAGSTQWETHLKKILSAWLTFDWDKPLAVGAAAYIFHIAMVITGFVGILAVGWRMQITLVGWVFTISLGMLTAGIFWLGCQIGVALSEGNA